MRISYAILIAFGLLSPTPAIANFDGLRLQCVYSDYAHVRVAHPEAPLQVAKRETRARIFVFSDIDYAGKTAKLLRYEVGPIDVELTVDEVEGHVQFVQISSWSTSIHVVRIAPNDDGEFDFMRVAPMESSGLDGSMGTDVSWGSCELT